jgi:uroporphyrinogen III methyltransferase / synthase
MTLPPATPPRSLRGVGVLLTRALEDAQQLRPLLEKEGAIVSALPAIQRVPPPDWGPVDDALRTLHRYDWLAFTSRHAVHGVSSRLSEIGVAAALPPSVKVAASGPATSGAIVAAGWRADCLAEAGGAQALAEGLAAVGVRSSRILVPGSDLMRPALRDLLTAAGAIVETVTVYRTIPPERNSAALEGLRHGQIDIIVLASPSAVRNLMELAGREVVAKARLVCIGQTTARAVEESGLQVAATADMPSAEGLLEAVMKVAEGTK